MPKVFDRGEKVFLKSDHERPKYEKKGGGKLITINAVGDIMLTDNVEAKFPAGSEQDLLRNVSPLLCDADYTIGNLECPLSTGGTSEGYKEKAFQYRADPRWAIPLSVAGFNILSLANNHILDYGPSALNETMVNLEECGIGYCGAGGNLEEASKPLIREANGVKVAFLAFTYAFAAKKRQPGCCPCEIEFIEQQVRSASKCANLVVASIHHGVEYVDYPNRYIMSLFRKAADAGAQLVIGHHPHVVQGLEVYKKSLIAYSLGNFVSDFASEAVRRDSYSKTALSYFGNHSLPINDMRTIESFILQCKFGPDGGFLDYKLIPVTSAQDFSVVPMDQTESQVFLERVQAISEKILQPDDPVWDEMDELWRKCKMLSLKNVRPRDILSKLIFLRPRHLKAVLPFIQAKLSKDV